MPALSLRGRSWAVAATLLLAAAGPVIAQDRAEAIRTDLLDARSPRLFTVAHRACWSRAPENSLRAIDDCVALGVDLVEIDVRISADGVPVLFHDRTVDRMTETTGAAAALNAADLVNLRLRDRNGGASASLSDQTVPTLVDALRHLNGRMIAHLDIKDGPAGWPAVWAAVQAAGAERWVLMKVLDPPEADSWRTAPFVGQALVRSRIQPSDPGDLMRQLCALQPLSPVAHTVMFEDPAIVDAVRVSHDRCPAGRIWIATQDPAYAGGLTDALAAQDPDAVWGRLIDAGATILETDAPERLVAYLRTRAERAPEPAR